MSRLHLSCGKYSSCRLLYPREHLQKHLLKSKSQFANLKKGRWKKVWPRTERRQTHSGIKQEGASICCNRCVDLGCAWRTGVLSFLYFSLSWAQQSCTVRFGFQTGHYGPLTWAQTAIWTRFWRTTETSRRPVGWISDMSVICTFSSLHSSKMEKLNYRNCSFWLKGDKGVR